MNNIIVHIVPSTPIVREVIAYFGQYPLVSTCRTEGAWRATRFVALGHPALPRAVGVDPRPDRAPARRATDDDRSPRARADNWTGTYRRTSWRSS